MLWISSLVLEPQGEEPGADASGVVAVVDGFVVLREGPGAVRVLSLDEVIDPDVGLLAVHGEVAHQCLFGVEVDVESCRSGAFGLKLG